MIEIWKGVVKIIIGIKKRIEIADDIVDKIVSEYNSLTSIRQLGKKYKLSDYYITEILTNSNIKLRKNGCKGNNYIIDEENNIAKIELLRKDGDNFWSIIDLDDLERVRNFPYAWCASWDDRGKSFYCHTSDYSNGTCKKLALQVFIANPNGDKTVIVDHINHDTLDNRKENLRKTTQKKNLRNRESKNSNNKTGYRNVAYIKSSKHPYWVQLMVNGKNTVLGKFNDVHEAGEFAKEMRKKYYGDFAGKS